MMKLGYQKWIDIYKGIAILLIVLGHGILPERVYGILFAFHLPLFFYLSGYTIEENLDRYKFDQFFIQKFYRIILPYFLALFSFIPIQIIYSNSFTFGELMTRIYNLVETFVLSSPDALSSNQFSTFLWFFPLFFVFQISLFFIFKYLKKWMLYILLSFTVMALFLFYYANIGDYSSSSILWGLDKLPLVLIFGLLSHLGKQFIARIEKYGRIEIIFVLFVVLVSMPENFRFELLSMSAPSIPMFVFYSFMGFVMVYFVSKEVEISYKILGKLIGEIGKKSMQILYSHSLIHYFVYPLIGLISLGHMYFNVIMMIGSIVSYPLIVFICRNNIEKIEKFLQHNS